MTPMSFRRHRAPEGRAPVPDDGTAAAIEVRGLTKRYGAAAVVDDVTFSVAPGESVALWGPNGAGKSTVIRCLLGSVTFEGESAITGHDVRLEPKRARRRLGYVPQHLAFYDDLSVAETVLLSARLRGMRAVDVRAALDPVALADQVSKRVGALSGGMKQRLAIALALISDPPVLLLDEPTSSLDVAARQSVLEVFDTLRDGRRAILLSSHQVDEVGVLADRVLAMDAGRVVLEAPPSEFAARLGLAVRVHLRVAPSSEGRALDVLRSAGFAPAWRGGGLLVDARAGGAARPISVLSAAGIEIADVEVWR